jgi:hypothetical protein
MHPTGREGEIGGGNTGSSIQNVRVTTAARVPYVAVIPVDQVVGIPKFSGFAGGRPRIYPTDQEIETQDVRARGTCNKQRTNKARYYEKKSLHGFHLLFVVKPCDY